MGKEANDNYPTPQPLADAITQFCYELFPQKKILIDPSCGEGNFLRPMLARWAGATTLGVDLVPDYLQPVQALGVPFVNADFIQYAPALGPGWLNENTLVLTNPPYGKNLPKRFIQAITANAAPGCHIAFLLRQSFLGSIDRALRFKERKSLRIKRDIAGRPKFDVNSKQQDHSEYAVFIYEVGYSGHYLGWGDPLLWKPKHLAEQVHLLAPAEQAPVKKRGRPRKAASQAA